MKKIAPLTTVALLLLLLTAARPRASTLQTTQTSQLLNQEAQTVYLGNLARRDNGLPPLRWNDQLTQAGRWFSWDSVANRPDPYCGHQDTQGNWPDVRALTFGYGGAAGAENAYCGYVTPAQAIQGWLDSPGHRDNLLAAGHREVGLGYYRDDSGQGYVTQDFGSDPTYAPLIIENEAIDTPTQQVNLYIYNPESNGGFSGLDGAAEMQLGPDKCLTGSQWEPYQAEKAFTLPPGEGWRTVFARLRDRFGRTMQSSDAIYLGPNPPADLSFGALLSSKQPDVHLYQLDSQGLPYMQFSPGWLADNSHANFTHLWGPPVTSTPDPAAQGGSAARMEVGDGSEGRAWVWTTDFVRDLPLVAYFRLKVEDNTSTQEVARVWVEVGNHQPTSYGPLILKGADFAAAGQYQEFAVAFTYHPTHPDDSFLIFQFSRSGSTAVWVDAVSIFTAPIPAQPSFTWGFPGGNYRGQGVKVRFTDGDKTFTPAVDAQTNQPGLNVAPTTLSLMASPQRSSALNRLRVLQSCGSLVWRAASSAAWLHFNTLSSSAAGSSLQVWADARSLAPGHYQADLTLSAEDGQTVQVPVTLTVADQLFSLSLPFIRR